MTSRQPSLPFWLAHASLQLALRLWPKESRDWGHALAAELDEIEKPFEALRWAIGGIMFFSRASASHFLAWLKLPAGSALSSTSLPTGVSAAVLPKRSRLFTVAILLATAVVVCLPQSREAISTVRGSWNGYRGYSSDVRDLRNLAARAEKERDARTLAFVALAAPDTGSAMRESAPSRCSESSYSSIPRPKKSSRRPWPLTPNGWLTWTALFERPATTPISIAIGNLLEKSGTSIKICRHR
ncbi:MAG: hypothetical protein DMG53_04265 [Acidobacteria bacterium]|nr:MAG: hypothetical protein DMG53_04265 [Acidobacteriota bacterium]